MTPYPELFTQFLIHEGLFREPIKTTPLADGLWNHTVKVETGSQAYVFKTFCEVPEDSFFPNVACDEAKALQRLSGLDISPEHIGLWPDKNLLVYQYVKGQQWRDDVDAVARCLNNTHH